MVTGLMAPESVNGVTTPPDGAGIGREPFGHRDVEAERRIGVHDGHLRGRARISALA